MGQLSFRHKGIQKYLFFMNGDLIHAQTNQSQELLGEVLFKLGKLSEKDYDRIDEYIEPKKSLGESLIGYGTIHGDMACAINPIGDLYKTQVRQLGRHLGVPANILTKTPTAGLWDG
ncbi:unnamed protein product, partial [marine sediment metagenome]